MLLGHEDIFQPVRAFAAAREPAVHTAEKLFARDRPNRGR